MACCPEYSDYLYALWHLQGKWVKLAAQGKGKVSVQQHSLESKGLAAYLALPMEQYSLLEPTWIERQLHACTCIAGQLLCPKPCL